MLLRITAFLSPRSCSVACQAGKITARDDRIDRSRFPVLRPDDVSESLARGSGPGGQSVNKSNNAVRLVHAPTGVEVRVHQSRSLEQNRQIAWKRLAEAIDCHVNGENSVAAQLRRLEQKDEELRKLTREKRREAKRLEKEQASMDENETKCDEN